MANVRESEGGYELEATLPSLGTVTLWGRFDGNGRGLPPSVHELRAFDTETGTELSLEDPGLEDDAADVFVDTVLAWGKREGWR